MPNLGGYFSVVAADLNVVGIDVQFPMVVLIGVVSVCVQLVVAGLVTMIFRV